MKSKITTLAILDHLTRHRPDVAYVDEMRHTGGAGITLVQSWPLSREADSPYVWRLMHVAANRSHVLRCSWAGQRIAFNVANSQEEAVRDGSKEARRLAKVRREQQNDVRLAEIDADNKE